MPNFMSEWQYRETMLLLVGEAVKHGFTSPVKVEVRDANGNGLDADLYFSNGKVVNSEHEAVGDTNRELEPPFKFTMYGYGETRGIEVSVTPEHVN